VIVAGAALLGWIAGDMMVHDLAVKGWVAGNASWLQHAAPVTGAVLVVLAGKWFVRRAAATQVDVTAHGSMQERQAAEREQP
jgi:predicted tellurium resistance membrane protein TerC